MWLVVMWVSSFDDRAVGRGPERGQDGRRRNELMS